MTLVSEPDARGDPWTPRLEPGKVVADKYRVERLLGRGGMAWVFEATHVVLQRRVALKVLRIDKGADNTDAMTRFRREARAAASVSGEATVRVMDVGTLSCGSPFLVMEYLEGQDLDRAIDRHTGLPVPAAVDYVLQACEGLAETHAAGVVHRDLKPSNLFLTRSPDGSARVKLLDFGISKFADPSLDEHRVTRTREIVGSPVYMSPEQMRSSLCADRRSDIWSMGVILYELLAQGRSPFDAPTLPEICARVLHDKPVTLGSIRREVPRALERIVLRCLEKDPLRRFQTVADLAMALVPFGPPDARRRADRIRRIGDESRGGSVPPPRARPGWLRVVPVGGGVAVLGVIALSATLGSTPGDVHAAGIFAVRAHDPPPHSVDPPSLSSNPSATAEPIVLVHAAPETTSFAATTPTAHPDPVPGPAGTSAAERLRRARGVSRTPPTSTGVEASPSVDIPEFGERE